MGRRRSDLLFDSHRLALLKFERVDYAGLLNELGEIVCRFREWREKCRKAPAVFNAGVEANSGLSKLQGALRFEAAKATFICEQQGQPEPAHPEPV